MHRAKAFAAGATAYVTKPIDPIEILRVVEAALKQARELRTKPQSAKILVVEDNADTRNGLMIRLRTAGFAVAGAADASTAIPTALREQPDLVILDIGLPGGDGLGVLRRLRTNPKLGGVSVIVNSAQDPASSRKRALEAGASDYFEKPADEQALSASIRRILGRW